MQMAAFFLREAERTPRVRRVDSLPLFFLFLPALQVNLGLLLFAHVCHRNPAFYGSILLSIHDVHLWGEEPWVEGGRGGRGSDAERMQGQGLGTSLQEKAPDLRFWKPEGWEPGQSGGRGAGLPGLGPG